MAFCTVFKQWIDWCRHFTFAVPPTHWVFGLHTAPARHTHLSILIFQLQILNLILCQPLHVWWQEHAMLGQQFHL